MSEQTRGGITVTNAADDGTRPDPVANMNLPIRHLGEHEMALHEEMAEGSLGDTSFKLHRTFDGNLWVYVDDTCYVISFEDIIVNVIAAVQAAEEAARRQRRRIQDKEET